MLIGIDVVDIERLRAAIEFSPRLRTRLFSPRELASSERRSDPVLHLAGTLAAKEAAAKALRLPLPPNIRRLEVLRAPDGSPTVKVPGLSGELALSIAHDGPVAVAVASTLPETP